MLNEQGVQPQALEVNDFSGGMTDKYIGAGTKYFQAADNLTISDNSWLVTRPGLTLASTDYPRNPTALRINKFFDTIDQLFEVSNSKVYYRNGSGYHLLAGPSGNNVFGAGTSTSYISTTFWNRHALLANSSYANVMKVFNDGTNWKAHQLGLPKLASNPTITGTGSGHTYRYAFHYYYQYTSQGVLFEEVGPVLDGLSVTNTNTPNVTNIAISTIPALTNTAATNYDTVNLRIKIFRTIDNGPTYYQIGDIPNGTLTFTDNFSDATVQTGSEIYVTGGLPDHEGAPPAKFVHSVNDILWLGNIKDPVTGAIYPNKLRLSNRFSLWSCPGAFEEDFDEEIKGINSINIYPIVFCQNKVYRIEGFYNPDGTGGVQKKLISQNAGCISNNSVVSTEAGLYWAGNNGFYFTDGSTVTRVSELFNDTFKAITQAQVQKDRIVGTYNPTRQTVLWTMQNDIINSDCDTIFVAHIRYGVKPDTPFTTWSGEHNFSPTCLHQFKGDIYHADTRGYVLKYDDTILTDPEIDTTLSVSLWNVKSIIYLYLGPAFDFGSSSVRKWVPLIAVYADNVSSISMLISSNNDNSGLFRDLVEIHYKGNIEWGEYDVEWGDANLRWNYFPVISAKRRFPAGGLRCSYKQIRITNAFTEIETSNALGKATFNAGTGEITLDDPTKIWPNDIVDYYVLQEADDYAKKFLITGRNSNTSITVETVGSPIGGSQNWIIKGIRKREILKLISYVIDYGFTSPTQDSVKAVS